MERQPLRAQLVPLQEKKRSQEQEIEYKAEKYKKLNLCRWGKFNPHRLHCV